MGNMNRWVGNRVSVWITGAFEVTEESDKGKRIVDLCCWKGFV